MNKLVFVGYASLCSLYQFTTILLPHTRCSGPLGVGNDTFWSLVLAVATFASMELFPVVFLPTSPRVGGCNGFGAAMELDSCYL